ncbi:MAG: anaerobic ribonucleoside triphosphate reductase [Clostridiales bacterium]|jgi:ribonucleoside-triphosphate reductase|nr:anaerobic ribonucleoside triphosphate reductase [Clostridiales bacterium]
MIQMLEAAETIAVTGIVKRDGRTVEFNEEKIVEAVRKSFLSIGEKRSHEYYRSIASEVVSNLRLRRISLPDVEQVQDMVEEMLIRRNHASAAKAYILYRSERSKIRDMNSMLMKTYSDLTFQDAKSSNIKRENANINGDTAMGVMLKYGCEGSKHFYKMFLLDPEQARAHSEGDIHIHDLDFYGLTTTCCQIDLIKLFEGGFSTGHGILREPNSIISSAALACIAIQANQNDQHGGQSIANFDYGLAKAVGKTFKKHYRNNLSKSLELLFGLENADGIVEKACRELSSRDIPLRLQDFDRHMAEEKLLLQEILPEASFRELDKCQQFAALNAEKAVKRDAYQAMEALIHNLNTMHSRAGAQTPFSSINYGTDTSPEGRLVTESVLLALEAGLGHGETPIFPIHIFRVKEGINFNKTDKNYDLFQLACRVSAKRLFPNFSFQDAPFNMKYYKENRPETEISYMGCRTRVISNVYDPGNEITYGRGNLSFTSVNLPRLGIKAGKDTGKFFLLLDGAIDICIKQLLDRFNIISLKKVKNFPFLMGSGIWTGSECLGPEDSIAEILKHGTLTVGFIGLAECLTALTGCHHGQSQASQALGLKIIGHMRKRMDESAQQHKLNFSLIATPAEGLSGRFVELDRKRYGCIPGITDREYYTNSFHVPVYFPISAFKKIKIEAPYHELTNAGHITYVELNGDISKNPAAFEKIIRFMKESGVGYGSVNHPIDRDPVCGYAGIIGDVCPKCGRSEEDYPFERIRRITGYLVGALDRFNNAKLAEVKERVTHHLR